MEQKYVEQMEEIKRRIESIEKLAGIAISNLYLAVVTESVYLQFRKILELIAMASLVANREAMEDFGRSMKKISKLWNGEEILKKVGAINPEFYPAPIVERPSNQPGVKIKIEDKTMGFLTQDMFSELYNLKCAPLLHAENPFGRRTNYQELWNEVPVWKKRIMELLNSHRIKLAGQDGFHLVHMQDAKNGVVHIYEFERMEKIES